MLVAWRCDRITSGGCWGRRRCFVQTDLAITYLLARDLEQAAELGRDALRTAAEGNSTRTLDRLRTLQRQLHPFRSAPGFSPLAPR